MIKRRWLLGMLVLAFGLGAFNIGLGSPGEHEEQRGSDRRIAQAPAGQLPVPVIPVAKTGVAEDPIVIPDCRLACIDKQEVPSQRDGVIWFIGTDIQPGEVVPPDRLITIKVGDKEMRYRRLREDDVVKKGQLLAQLDDRLARDDYEIKLSKITAAEADLEATKKTRDEAHSRLLRQEDLFKKRATAKEELDGARLAYEKYHFETHSKQAALSLSKRELSQSDTVMDQHKVRSSIDGIIKTIYKQPGEAVKSSPSYEPVFLIRSLDRLRAEGLVDFQQLPRLKKGMKVTIEPIVAQGPDQTLIGHLQEVTGVAVSKDAKPLIVSCSEDGTIRVWSRASRKELRRFQMPSHAAARAVACTPVGSAGNLCLVGGSDGRAYLWDLDAAADEPLRELNSKHREAINSVAFNHDGTICATSGDDREICLWSTDSGELMYRLKGHSGPVTSLQFTPQGQLVSASRDRTIKLWTCDREQGKCEQTSFTRRSGDLTKLGTSHDGKRILFDPGQANQLRILSLPDGTTEGILRNLSSIGHFANFAFFSPDGKTIITAGSAEGRLQLWRTPTETTRGYELRRMISNDRSTPTCAVFSPDGSFIVTGTKERNVLVWPMPSTKEIEERIVAEITNIEQSLDPSTNQVRIWAEFDNREYKLLPGETVTMVRYPE